MATSTANNKHPGFTLIELLIVIGVIGILAGTVLTLINPLEQFAKARDSERKKTLQELASALERYMIKKGSYPITGGLTASWFSSEPGHSYPYGPGDNGDWIPGLLTSKEITRLPREPNEGISTIPYCIPASYRRDYLYQSQDGTCYKLLSFCAPEVLPLDPNDPFADPSRPAHAWMVCAPSGSYCCTNY